ncbi:MAG: DIP1984 family protein [Lachnospiraceae bacterium]|nr:DIP1984 family protein [Lachnospiraceae bacterium]
MRLATALSERADLQVRIDQLAVRLSNNAKVQEGEKPSEDPADLLKELSSCMTRLEELITRINLTNSRAALDGVTLTEYIAKRDVLKQEIRILRDFLNEASSKVDRYSNKEIRILSTVDVAGLQKQLDERSKRLRELDDKLQEANWTTELQ